LRKMHLHSAAKDGLVLLQKTAQTHAHVEWVEISAGEAARQENEPREIVSGSRGYFVEANLRLTAEVRQLQAQVTAMHEREATLISTLTDERDRALDMAQELRHKLALATDEDGHMAASVVEQREQIGRLKAKLCEAEEHREVEGRRVAAEMEELAARDAELNAGAAERERQLLERLTLLANLTASAQQQLDREKERCKQLAAELDELETRTTTELLEASHTIGRLRDRSESCVCDKLDAISTNKLSAKVIWCKPEWKPVLSSSRL